MAPSPARENILRKIRQALNTPTPLPFPEADGAVSVFEPAPPQEDQLARFAETFTGLQGRFVYCASPAELAGQLASLVNAKGWTKLFIKEDALKASLEEAGFNNPFAATGVAACEAAITACESLIARTGSIVMSSAQQAGRTTSVYAPVHICIAWTDQVVWDIRDALGSFRQKGRSLPSLVTLATGPSRTADIEKTLVVGVHGPAEVYCFVTER